MNLTIYYLVLVVAGETINIAEAAAKVSKIFKYFHWTELPQGHDLNFNCVKQDKHKPTTQAWKKMDYTHPTDVVFKYFDPYSSSLVFIHTDLKSYSKSSINSGSLERALKSLAKQVECAAVSSEWQGRYNTDHDDASEVKGMLFIYNHDGEYDGKIEEKLKQANLDGVQIARDQTLHLVTPDLIRYLLTITTDIDRLVADFQLPPNKRYSFHYPDLTLHKSLSDYEALPATIEVLSAPYMIIKHENFTYWDEDSKDNLESKTKGFLVYSRSKGDDVYEFMYLLDAFSRLQMFHQEGVIKLRLINENLSQDFKSHFESAKKRCIESWYGDSSKHSHLDKIIIENVDMVAYQFNPGVLAWREE